MAVLDATSNVLVARSVAAQLAEVGIQVEVTPLPTKEFYTEQVGRSEVLRTSKYGLVLASWAADMPVPGSFLVPLVDSGSIDSRGNTNYALLDWKQVDATVDAARKATDPAEARATWRKVAELARSTEAYVPLVETRVQLVAGQRLRNGVVMQPYGSYDLATAGVR
jgi:peptide/nickel transport system substrate-binding protein